MHSIVYSWKSYKVHLPVLEAWLKANTGEGYKGNSADASLTLWFEDEPSEEIKTAVDAQWDSLTEEGEAAKILLYENRNKAVDAARAALLTATFDSLIPAERKLWMNAALTDEDKDALLVKFPQG